MPIKKSSRVKAKKASKMKPKKMSKKTSKRKVKKSSLVKSRKTSKRKTVKRAVSYESGPGVHTDWKGKKGSPLIPHAGDLGNGHTGTRWFGTEVDWS
jgi:hypothetical protein